MCFNTLRPFPLRGAILLLFTLSLFLEELRYFKVEPLISVRGFQVRQVVLDGGENTRCVLVWNGHGFSLPPLIAR